MRAFAQHHFVRRSPPLHRRDFERRQFAPCARRQIAEFERADLRSEEAHDRMPDRFHHAAHLPVPPFVENQLHQKSSFFVSLAQFPGGCGRGKLALADIQALAQTLYRVVVGRPLHGRDIRFADRARRMRDIINEIPIVRQQEQAFAVRI